MRIKRLHSAHGFNKSLLGNSRIEVEGMRIKHLYSSYWELGIMHTTRL